jgi:hypothetical protein
MRWLSLALRMSRLLHAAAGWRCSRAATRGGDRRDDGQGGDWEAEREDGDARRGDRTVAWRHDGTRMVAWRRAGPRTTASSTAAGAPSVCGDE